MRKSETPGYTRITKSAARNRYNNRKPFLMVPVGFPPTSTRAFTPDFDGASFDGWMKLYEDNNPSGSETGDYLAFYVSDAKNSAPFPSMVVVFRDVIPGVI